MRTTLQNALLVTVVGLGWVVESPAFAQTTETPTFTVLLRDTTGIPDDILLSARGEASQIYAAGGLTLRWVDPSLPPCALCLTVTVMPQSRATRGRSDVMGVAPGAGAGSGRLAYAFYGTIESFARKHRVDVAALLGHVIAHELGHILLAYGHSPEGIMQAEWGSYTALNALARRRLTFTDEQAALLRSKVVAQTAQTDVSPSQMRERHCRNAANQFVTMWSLVPDGKSVCLEMRRR
jgi:hypothetical protein